MNSAKYLLTFLTTPFFIINTACQGSAFTLTYSSLFPGAYRAGVPYKTIAGNDAYAWVDQPIKPLPPPEQNSKIQRLLRQSFFSPKWVFKTATTDLKGAFDIKAYYACAPVPYTIPCGQGLSDIGIPKSNVVGSAIELNYIPFGEDPRPSTGRIRWIQRVTDNHAINGNHGDKENVIDIDQGAPYPYYDGEIGQVYNSSIHPFYDVPSRGDVGSSHDWVAQLYLAYETTPRGGAQRIITIYNGIQWGWHNRVAEKKKEPVPAPAPAPKPTKTPENPLLCPPNMLTKSGSTIVANSSSGGGGIGCVAVSPTPSPRPTPRPTPSPTPRPTPSPRPAPSPLPTPRPTPRPAPGASPSPTTSTIILVSLAPSPSPLTSTPLTSTPLTSTPLTSTPLVTSPLGSTSSTVVISTSTTTTTSPSPSPRPAPATSVSPAPAPAPSPGGRPIRAVPSSEIPNAVVSNLRSSSLAKSSSKANTDYSTARDLLEDSELSSTSSNLNNAKVAGVSRDLLQNPELSSTSRNQNQVNLADISSDLLEDSELSSTSSNKNQVNLADISSNLLENPELSSTDNNQNNADIGGISADLLEDPELSSEDTNSNQVDLAGISADLLEDPELSYLDDTLIAKTPKVSAKNTDDDALSAEAVPEPTTALGTLFALGVLPVIKRLKNRKNKE